MKPHLTQQLGYGPEDRLIIINSDDMGITHSANIGTIKALEEGFATAATIITVGPWAAEALDWWSTHRQYSIGIEVAITSEWQTIRWGPLSSRDKVRSLLDKDGFFWGNCDLVVQHAKVEEAELEVRTQLDYVIDRGFDPTHCLNHMFSLRFRPDLEEMFFRVLKHYRLPSRSPKLQVVHNWPSIDDWVGADLYYMSMDNGKESRFYQILQNLKPGLWEFYPHCAVDCAESRAAFGYSHTIPNDPNSWVGRHSDVELYTLPRAKKYLDDHGFKLVTYRQIRDAIRKNM